MFSKNSKALIVVIALLSTLFYSCAQLSTQYDYYDTDPYSDSHNPNKSYLGFYIGDTKIYQCANYYLGTCNTHVEWNITTVDNDEVLLVCVDLDCTGVYIEEATIHFDMIWLCLPLEKESKEQIVTIDNPDNAINCYEHILVDGVMTSIKYMVQINNLSFCIDYSDDKSINGTFTADAVIESSQGDIPISLDNGKFRLIKDNNITYMPYMTYDEWCFSR